MGRRKLYLKTEEKIDEVMDFIYEEKPMDCSICKGVINYGDSEEIFFANGYVVCEDCYYKEGGE